MTATQRKIIAEMMAAVPAGLPNLDYESREILRDLTDLLLDTVHTAEYDRYRGIRDRVLPVGELQDATRDEYRGKRILVTGGTGCIGSELLRQLLGQDRAEVFCIYALPDHYDPIAGVVYLNVDIRDEATTRSTIRSIRPDVIFHCAAQRSPWLAEREVALTLMSNVIGTRNVLRGARDVDVERFVHASTGKAMRYYTTDVYAASKKLAEWLVHDYAAEGRSAGLARFTHVVDNAVVLDKIDESMAEADAVMRVHDADTYFYAQSAAESAQLLSLAGADGRSGLHGVTIRELGEPVGLVDLVLGRIHRSEPRFSPVVYFSGHDKGYESANPPGLYDPATAGDCSPLINAIEAQNARVHAAVTEVDRFTLALPEGTHESDDVADRLADVCTSGSTIDMLAELTRDATRLAQVTLDACPPQLFERLDQMAQRAGHRLPVRQSVGAGGAR